MFIPYAHYCFAPCPPFLQSQEPVDQPLEGEDVSIHYRLYATGRKQAGSEQSEGVVLKDAESVLTRAALCALLEDAAVQALRSA